MIFTMTKLTGAYIIDVEKVEDHRGFFARTWCTREFKDHGVTDLPVQINMSLSRKRGTIRGFHYQVAPFAETKIIRCVAGAIYDVIIDVRSDSPTYRQWMAVELSAANHRMLFMPEYFAHAFQALEDDSAVFYQVSQFYSAEHERGVRYDDPAFSVRWPLEISDISNKDLNWPDFLV